MSKGEQMEPLPITPPPPPRSTTASAKALLHQRPDLSRNMAPRLPLKARNDPAYDIEQITDCLANG